MQFSFCSLTLLVQNIKKKEKEPIILKFLNQSYKMYNHFRQMIAIGSFIMIFIEYI